jgi:hypothetical protein
LLVLILNLFYSAENPTTQNYMLDVKYNIKGLVSSIYECQKKIILNRRFIREMEAEGQDITLLENENMKLEEQIGEYQKELKRKYQFSY